MKLSNFQYDKQKCRNSAFKGTVVNLALSSLHGGSLQITLTVSLSQSVLKFNLKT